MPDQSAIRKTCDIQEKEIYFFEHGGQLRESFHFEKFMPQNVKQMQKTFLTRFSHSLEFLIPKVRGYIDNWLNERLDSGTKDKSERNGKISEITQGRGKKIALICTSSLNEHELYSGAKPNLSQAELIKCSIQKLQNEGFEVIMRIHPNEMNNHWINLVNLMKAVITFDIKIIYPWDALSTYDLVEIADIVVVWDSTIGIEAYLLGKPIFVLNDSFYSDILNIPRITIQDLEFSNKIFVPYETLKSRGILAAYLRLSNGYSIFDDMFNKEMLSALRKKYVSSSYIVNNINSDYADSNIMRFVSYASTLINLRFPIHLERKFRKIFGVRFSGFAMKIILRFLILGGKVA
jgi:hypothetical protein